MNNDKEHKKRNCRHRGANLEYVSTEKRDDVEIETYQCCKCGKVVVIKSRIVTNK